jgi:lipopolysaccharide/colanic/teichoic acid biosynthesis glycosyltransferase
VFGAFLGVIGGTLLYYGLWEDNYPPPNHISQRVHRIHLDTIGVPPPPPWPKRFFDIALVIVGLAFSTPVWVVCILILWLEDPGPLFFVKNSVGLGGKNFHQFKFRTMVRGAEINTGPVLAREDDSRTLRFGRFLRKSALDELPQLINILRGEMSFVGPRPQRTILVGEYLKEMPEFAARHRVLPGLSGLAQVAGDYYLTPRQKLRFDRLYSQNASLGFDLKLILLAFLIVFWLRWNPGWDGRLPRSWLRWGARR